MYVFLIVTGVLGIVQVCEDRLKWYKDDKIYCRLAQGTLQWYFVAFSFIFLEILEHFLSPLHIQAGFVFIHRCFRSALGAEEVIMDVTSQNNITKVSHFLGTISSVLTPLISLH